MQDSEMDTLFVLFKGFDELGGLLKPTVASQNQSFPASKVPPNKLVSDDLDSSLANLVGSKYLVECLQYQFFKSFSCLETIHFFLNHSFVS